jgi:ABC transport system ATP-binding/permease protein
VHWLNVRRVEPIDDAQRTPRRHRPPVEDVVLRSKASDEEVHLHDAALLYDGRRIPLGPDGLAIGRDPDCDLVLASGLVAPVHARVEARGGRYHVVDLDSRTGTYVNGERLLDSARRIRAGDSIAIGDEILHFVTRRDAQLPPVELPTPEWGLRMDRPELTMGRDPGCDIVLDHPTVSPVHAEVIAGQQGIRIKDVSTGGTGLRLNGEFVSRAFLHTGDELGIGPYRFVFDGSLLQQRAVETGMRLDAEGVQFDAGGVTILQPTSLSVAPGELVALIGESGAGKSTLLKTLCGVHRPTAGRVAIDGEAVATRLNDVGYVPQDEIVHPLLTVREALGYAAELRLPQDTRPADREEAVAKVLEEMGLTQHADTRIDRLSGGQRKRAGVACELISQPGLLFLDEPTTGLDAGLELRMMKLFKALAEAGRPVLLVTHATRSLRLCDKVAVMGAGGRLCFYGTPARATEFFAVDDFDDLYLALEDKGSQYWRARFAAEIGRDEMPSGALDAVRRVRARPRPKAAQQAWTLIRRYAQVFARDHRNLRILALQVPLLALATALLFKRSVFEHGGSGARHAGESAQLLFLMTTVALWFGAIGGAREIVKERTVLHRELAVGVRLSAYLTSKAVLLFALTGLQTLALTVIVLVLRPLHEPSTVTFSVAVVLVLTAWCGAAMGLLISAMVHSEDQASSFIPLILVPQLLFGGAIVSTHDMGGLMAAISKLIVAQWAFKGLGTVIDMNTRIAQDPVFSQADKYGSHFFNLPAAGTAAVMMLFLAAFGAGLARLVQTRRAPA